MIHFASCATCFEWPIWMGMHKMTFSKESRIKWVHYGRLWTQGQLCRRNTCQWDRVLFSGTKLIRDDDRVIKNASVLPLAHVVESLSGQIVKPSLACKLCRWAKSHTPFPRSMSAKSNPLVVVWSKENYCKVISEERMTVELSQTIGQMHSINGSIFFAFRRRPWTFIISHRESCRTLFNR